MNKRPNTVNTNPLPALPPRGLRIQQAASYSGLSPFFVEEIVRAGILPAIGGPGSGVSRQYVILKDTLDRYLDELNEAAEKRAEERRKAHPPIGRGRHDQVR
jgi:hypothetical protein